MRRADRVEQTYTGMTTLVQESERLRSKDVVNLSYQQDFAPQ